MALPWQYKLAIFASLFVGLWSDNYSWGSASDTVFDLSQIQINSRFHSSITTSNIGYVSWGVLWASWIVVYMALFHLIDPVYVLSPETDDDYELRLVQFCIVINVLNVLYTFLEISGHFVLSIISLSLFLPATFLFFAYAHTRPVQFWLQLTVGLTYCWLSYGGCLLLSITIGGAAWPSFVILGLWSLQMIYMTREYKDWVPLAVCAVVWLGIPLNRYGIAMKL